jgi:hypothetical protein
MKLKDISIILIILGITTILCSLLDFYAYLYPVAIKSPEWVFEVSQRIADITILPILGILFALLGLNFSNFRSNKTIVTATKILCGFLCILFFSFLSFNSILYGISMKAVQNNKIESLKAESKSAKDKMNFIYNQNKKNIPVAEYNQAIKQLNDNLIYQISYLNLTHIKINIKTLMTLFLFSFVYLIAAIKIFFLDRLFQKRRNFVR